MTTMTSGDQLQTAPQKFGPAVRKSSLRHVAQSRADCRTASLPTKPKSGGTPAIDKDAMAAIQNSARWDFRSPDSLLRSRAPVILSIAPPTINKGAWPKE